MHRSFGKKGLLELIIKVIERICTNSFSGILIQENNTIFGKIFQLIFLITVEVYEIN